MTGNVKVKITWGSEPGLVGVHAIERMKTEGLVERVWKSEGISDLLAVESAIPSHLIDRHVAVTNSNGAKQHMGWMAALLARFDSAVLHDADDPGQSGGKAACQEIALQGGRPRMVVLPYEIAPDHGKDVRDWFNEGASYSDLMALAERSEVNEPAVTESGDVDFKKATFPVQESILRKLQLEILYENEDGKIRVFSTLLRKSSWIVGGVERLKKERLIQMCGPTAMQCISSDPDNETTWSISDVREAIALMASKRRESRNERGVGIWQGQDEREIETDALLLVNDTEASRWTGNGKLERVVTPHSDGQVLDFGSGHKDWFDHGELARYVNEAESPAWVERVFADLRNYLSMWRWKNPDSDPDLVVGLILASWVQTIWHWRPLVSVTGQTNAGKTLFFEFLGGTHGRRGIFGNLAFKQAKSTEAGIRQGIGNTARVVLCDEFEKTKDRDRILEMLRASTRGETISRGTSDQRGTTYSIRHIGWVSATESGLHRQPDINRFVQLELLVAEKSKQGQLVLPEGDFLFRLGQKSLAIAVTCAAEAKKLAVRLKAERVDGIDARTVEVYAVPAAMLALAVRYNEDEARGLLRELLKSVDAQEQGRTDHDDLLSDILSALVNCGAKDGLLTVSQIIESQSHLYEHASRLEAHGVSLVGDAETDGLSLVIAHRQVASKLLRNTAWEAQRIDQVLLRLPGAKRDRARIGGAHPRVVIVPLLQHKESSSDEF